MAPRHRCPRPSQTRDHPVTGELRAALDSPIEYLGPDGPLHPDVRPLRTVDDAFDAIDLSRPEAFDDGPLRPDDVEEQRYQGLVFSTLRSLLRARLIAKMPWNYVDATNLSIHERRQWIKMAKSFGYEVQAVFFDVPLEVCLERNHKRERVVADDVMRRMSAKLKAPTFEEGFSKITVERVKRKE